MEESGADALRFAVIHGATPGLDQRFGPQRLELGRNFANKLWNAVRFVLGARPGGIAADAVRTAPDAARLGPAEQWIRSRLAAAVAEVDRGMADYQFGEVTRALYDGIWSEFCDWGLELAKVRLADESLPAADRDATWWTLVEAIDTYLRLLHPVMPFVTEELWAALPHAPEDPPLLVVARWPAAGPRDPVAESAVGALVDLVRAVRNARSEAGVEPGRWLGGEVLVPTSLAGPFDALRPALERLSRCRPLVRHAERDSFLAAAGSRAGLSVVVGEIEADIALGEGAVGPPAAELARLEKELAEAERLLESARARLADAAFTAKAPAAVVEGARVREAGLADQVSRLRERLRR
jgi:valyl-tRNA synthetase